MPTARKKNDDARIENIERRLVVLEGKLDGTEEDREDQALVDDAWRHQGGRPLTSLEDLKRQLRIK